MDIVERLRALVIIDEVGSDNPLARDAIAEIARLRDALREIDGIIKRPQMSCGDRTAEIGRITSAALGERE